MSHDPIQEQTTENTENVTAQEKTRNFNPTRKQREQLKALSKEIFGASSKWQKLMEYDHVLTHKVKETVPGENGEPDAEREVEVPLFVAGTKVKQSVRKHRSIEEVLTLLLDFKAKRDEYVAKVKAAQEEAKKKREEEEQARKVQEQLGGSALT